MANSAGLKEARRKSQISQGHQEGLQHITRGWGEGRALGFLGSTISQHRWSWLDSGIRTHVQPRTDP